MERYYCIVDERLSFGAKFVYFYEGVSKCSVMKSLGILHEAVIKVVAYALFGTSHSVSFVDELCFVSVQ